MVSLCPHCVLGISVIPLRILGGTSVQEGKSVLKYWGGYPLNHSGRGRPIGF